MATFSIVMPVFVGKCRLLPNVPILFDEKTSARSLRQEHIGAIVTKRKDLVESFSSATKCIIIECGQQADDPKDIYKAALIGTFTLNIFAADGAMALREAFIIRSSRVHTILDSLEIPNQHSASSKTHYKMEASAKPSSIQALYGATAIALEKDPSLSISLSRLNSALSRSSLEDKAIDMAISLESIFQSSTEISFRFSLYNSILSESDRSKRVLLFNLLKEFYNKRSKIVHGTGALDAAWINTHWPQIVKVAKASLIAKIEFLQSNRRDDWQRHLDQMALGAV